MILITGASGFVGAHLLNAAISKFGNENLVAISSRNVEACQTIVYQNFGFNLSSIDLSLLRQVEIVIHVGSFTPKEAKEVNLLEKCNQNIIFTENMLSLPFENLKKIIYISTLDVYENSDEISEFSKTVPATLYGLSKLYCERMISSFTEINCLDFQILRLGHIYGPGEDRYRKFIPLVMQKILSGKEIELWGDGEDIRSFIYIDDVVEAIISAIKLVKNVGPINIVGGHPIPIRNLLDMIIQISGKTVSVVNKKSIDDSRNYIFDNSKMIKYLLSKETALCAGLKAEYAYMKRIYEHNI